MTKITKLSLIAAIAVAGTTASAQPLAEAIKNVDISGTATYRYNDYEDTNSTNNYKIAADLKSKVTDDVTFNSRIIIGADTGVASLNTSTSGDSNLDLELSEANFTYTGVKNASVTVGKQGVATAFTVHRDSMGDESTGTGILATYTFAPVTFAAAYFNQTNINNIDGKDVAAIAVMGSFGPISADAWYLDVDDVLDAYTVGLSGNFDLGAVTLNPSIRYSEQDNDGDNDEVSTFKAEIAASMGMFNAYVGYGETDDEGGVAIDGNSSDTVVDPHWRVGLIDQADADIIYAGIGAQVTEKINVSLKHTNLDNTTGVADQKETYVQVVYDHAANLSTFVRLGEFKEDGSQGATSGRVQVQYTF